MFFFLQLPCVMWLAIKKPEKFGLSWLINWVWLWLKPLHWFHSLPYAWKLKAKLISIWLHQFSDMHYTGCSFDDCVTYWRAKANYNSSNDLSFLLLSLNQIVPHQEELSQIVEKRKSQWYLQWPWKNGSNSWSNEWDLKKRILPVEPIESFLETFIIYTYH